MNSKRGLKYYIEHIKQNFNKYIFIHYWKTLYYISTFWDFFFKRAPNKTGKNSKTFNVLIFVNIKYLDIYYFRICESQNGIIKLFR